MRNKKNLCAGGKLEGEPANKSNFIPVLLSRFISHPTPTPPTPIPFFVNSFCCLIFTPTLNPPPPKLLAPIRSVSRCLSLREQTGRDREAVVVLAV